METLAILNTVVKCLQETVPELDVLISATDPVEYVPEGSNPTVLLEYSGSDFASLISTDAIVLKRTLKMTVTVIVPKIDEAINVLDRVRIALGGISLPGCECPLWPVNENYIGENAGVCRYILELATNMPFIVNQVSDNLPLLTLVNYKEEIL